MKKRLFAIFITALFGLFIIAESQAEVKPESKPSKVRITKIPSSAKEGRPRIPAMVTVDCWLFEGELYIKFRQSEGECYVTAIDNSTGFTITDTFDSVMPYTLYIGTPASATITIVTEAENIYYGEIQ